MANRRKCIHDKEDLGLARCDSRMPEVGDYVKLIPVCNNQMQLDLTCNRVVETPPISEFVNGTKVGTINLKWSGDISHAQTHPWNLWLGELAEVMAVDRNGDFRLKNLTTNKCTCEHVCRSQFGFFSRVCEAGAHFGKSNADGGPKSRDLTTDEDTCERVRSMAPASLSSPMENKSNASSRIRTQNFGKSNANGGPKPGNLTTNENTCERVRSMVSESSSSPMENSNASPRIRTHEADWNKDTNASSGHEGCETDAHSGKSNAGVMAVLNGDPKLGNLTTNGNTRERVRSMVPASSSPMENRPNASSRIRTHEADWNQKTNASSEHGELTESECTTIETY